MAGIRSTDLQRNYINRQSSTQHIQLQNRAGANPLSLYGIDEFVDAVKREGVRAGSVLELDVLRGGLPIDVISLEIGAADTSQNKIRALRIMAAVQDEDPAVALLKSAGATVGLEVESHIEGSSFLPSLR